MASYNELMTAMVKKFMDLAEKELIISKARSVYGLKVADDGTVTEGSKEKMKALLDSYKQLAGQVVVIMAKRAIKPLLTGKEDLPDELRL